MGGGEGLGSLRSPSARLRAPIFTRSRSLASFDRPSFVDQERSLNTAVLQETYLLPPSTGDVTSEAEGGMMMMRTMLSTTFCSQVAVSSSGRRLPCTYLVASPGLFGPTVMEFPSATERPQTDPRSPAATQVNRALLSLFNAFAGRPASAVTPRRMVARTPDVRLVGRSARAPVTFAARPFPLFAAGEAAILPGRYVNSFSHPTM